MHAFTTLPSDLPPERAVDVLMLQASSVGGATNGTLIAQERKDVYVPYE